MRKLAAAATLVFLIGILAVVILTPTGDGLVVNTFSQLQMDGSMHYFFTVRTGKIRQTIEVTEEAYAAHTYGDKFNPAWSKVWDFRR